MQRMVKPQNLKPMFAKRIKTFIIKGRSSINFYVILISNLININNSIENANSEDPP